MPPQAHWNKTPKFQGKNTGSCHMVEDGTGVCLREKKIKNKQELHAAIQAAVKIWWLSGIDLLSTADEAAGLELLHVLSLPNSTSWGLEPKWSSSSPTDPDQLSHGGPIFSGLRLTTVTSKKLPKDICCRFSRAREGKNSLPGLIKPS